MHSYVSISIHRWSDLIIIANADTSHWKSLRSYLNLLVWERYDAAYAPNRKHWTHTRFFMSLLYHQLKEQWISLQVYLKVCESVSRQPSNYVCPYQINARRRRGKMKSLWGYGHWLIFMTIILSIFDLYYLPYKKSYAIDVLQISFCLHQISLLIRYIFPKCWAGIHFVG